MSADYACRHLDVDGGWIATPPYGRTGMLLYSRRVSSRISTYEGMAFALLDGNERFVLKDPLHLTENASR